MAELVNLRMARKRAKRRQKGALADAGRLAHGEPKRLRTLAAARHAKSERDHERHKMETGDDR